MNSLQINLFANISAEGDHGRQVNNLYNVKKVITWTAPNSANLSCLKASITVGIIYPVQRPGQSLQSLHSLHLKVSCN